MLQSIQGLRRALGLGATAVAVAFVTVGSPAAAAPTVPAGAQVNAFAWGLNDSGQLGNGGFDPQPTPLPIGGLANVRQVGGGQLFSAALLADGTVETWGYDGQGQLGDGRTVQQFRTVPAPVPGLSGVIQIATGANHTLALRSDGTVWAWGYNAFRQLGDGTQTDRPTPFQIQGLSGIVQVSAGDIDSFAVAADGSVFAWGHNGFGELGDGTTTNRVVPERLPGLSGVLQVSAGNEHGLAVRNDGTVWAWGNNAHGQLGLGNTTNHAVPQQVPGLTGATQVAAGFTHSLAVAGTDHSVWSWGDDADSELGDGATVERHSPIHLALANIAQIAAGQHQSAAVSANGSLSIWGLAYFSSVTGPTTVPTPFPLPNNVGGATRVLQVALGTASGLAVGIPSTTVPDVSHRTLTQATAAIQAAGLSVGRVTGVVDPSCNDLGKVTLQDPSAGTQAALGSPVDLTIGQRPTDTECP